MTVSNIIPVFNEEKTILSFLIKLIVNKDFFILNQKFQLH